MGGGGGLSWGGGDGGEGQGGCERRSEKNGGGMGEVSADVIEGEKSKKLE